MDALTHAVEAYIGNSTTKETRADATKAITLIFMNLAKAVNDPGDLDARKNMLEAAFMAGNAFSSILCRLCPCDCPLVRWKIQYSPMVMPMR